MNRNFNDYLFIFPAVVLFLILDFGGHLFDSDVLAMPFAPKDEHEAPSAICS